MFYVKIRLQQSVFLHAHKFRVQRRVYENGGHPKKERDPLQIHFFNIIEIFLTNDIVGNSLNKIFTSIWYLVV